jgi:hypothetical protein
MSVIKTILINCDGCGDTYGDGDDKIYSAKKQRTSFKESGWKHKNGKDYCEECKKKLSE